MEKNKKNIVIIGGGNGNSRILELLYNQSRLDKTIDDIHISSIVSMSDDGRTTGLLMRAVKSELGIDLPPPGDVRRCLYALSKSTSRDQFKQLFETVFTSQKSIKEFSILSMLENIGADNLVIQEIKKNNAGILEYMLPLDAEIKGHKFGNILMTSVYYNVGDYNTMLEVMSDLLDVVGDVIPVTTDKALIQARLENGEVIKTQDHISNVPDYDSPISGIELMRDGSENAKLNKHVITAFKKADYIIIGPGDLYTSILANYIIPGFTEALKNTTAQICYVGNNNNKAGETGGYSIEQFIEKISDETPKKLDYLFINNTIPELSETEIDRFKSDISVKGGEYLCLNQDIYNTLLFQYPNLEIISGDYIDRVSLYKHDKNLILDMLKLFQT